MAKNKNKNSLQISTSGSSPAHSARSGSGRMSPRSPTPTWQQRHLSSHLRTIQSTSAQAVAERERAEAAATRTELLAAAARAAAYSLEAETHARESLFLVHRTRIEADPGTPWQILAAVLDARDAERGVQAAIALRNRGRVRRIVARAALVVGVCLIVASVVLFDHGKHIGWLTAILAVVALAIGAKYGIQGYSLRVRPKVADEEAHEAGESDPLIDLEGEEQHSPRSNRS